MRRSSPVWRRLLCCHSRLFRLPRLFAQQLPVNLQPLPLMQTANSSFLARPPSSCHQGPGPSLSVHAGGRHLCPGELVCAGDLTMPEELGPVVAVASGHSHVCAVKATGELVCFGDNDCGQCDVPTDLGPVVAVAAGFAHTCALTAAGDVVCFGVNGKGQCDVPPGLGSTVLLACWGRWQVPQADPSAAGHEPGTEHFFEVTWMATVTLRATTN